MKIFYTAGILCMLTLTGLISCTDAANGNTLTQLRQNSTADGTKPLPENLLNPPTFSPLTGLTSPFWQNSPYGSSFRIPALVTLDDGSLAVAADARWNTSYDGGGLDTVSARSDDGGKRWETKWANRLEDNGNGHNTKSTSFIDPALATDGKTIYLLTDLYPWGVALNGGAAQPQKVSGFDSEGRLLLTKKGENAYNYYLEGTVIKDRQGNTVPDYTVDARFFISHQKNAVPRSNLFFENSPFQVQRTSYLYLVKSIDGGRNWSAPSLIPLKKASEQAYLVGPGRGLVTTTGRIVFPCYSFSGNSNSQRMDFIYSDDKGETWKRSAPSTGSMVSSESAVVELNDGTLRFFFRNMQKRLYYIDHKGSVWGSPVNTGIVTSSNCQISAISYSKTHDGRQIILVSCPTGPSNSDGSTSSLPEGRVNGRIFVGTVGRRNRMNWLTQSHITVNSGNQQFLYSCLTELEDGSIGLLYESKGAVLGVGAPYFCTINFKRWKLNTP